MSERDHQSTPTNTTSSILTIDGLSVARHQTPESIAEIADLLREANDKGDVVIPYGGGTQLGLGNIPAAADVGLHLTKLNQIVQYEPDDLTIAVRAGCRIDQLNALLAEHGQMLPFETARPQDATIGGVYATAISGPRRFGHGSMRDLVIGISTVSPGGELARAGGMVVKNVTGYDMMRLHYGALGSLGVIVQLNFKVLPKPPSQRTVLVRFERLADASKAAVGVRESQLSPTAIVLLDDGAATAAGLHGAPWSLLLRAEGPTEAASSQIARLRDATTEGAIDVEMFEDDETETLWRSANAMLSAAPEESALSARLGMPASTVPQLAGELIDATDAVTATRQLSLDVGNGLLFAHFFVESGRVADLRELWKQVYGLGTHSTLLAAPPEVKRDIDVFGAEPAGFRIMRALKQRFDPSETLNRGRFIGKL